MCLFEIIFLFLIAICLLAVTLQHIHIVVFMRSAFLTVLLIIPFVLVAKNRYTSADTARINKMVRNVGILLSHDRDSAITLVKAAHKEALALDYEIGIADAGWWIGTLEMYMSRYSEARNHYDRSLEIYKKYGLEDKQADVYITLGINEGMQEQSAKALGWFLQAKHVAEHLQDDRQIADINYKIGIIYGQVNDFETAIRYTEQSLRFAERIVDTHMMVIVYNNLGALYSRMKKYDKSLDALRKGRTLTVDPNNENVIPEIYQNIGGSYREIGEYELSWKYLDSAFQRFTATSFPQGICGTAIGIADLFVRQGKYDQALGYLHKANTLAEMAGNESALYEINVLLHKAYAGQGRYKDATALFDTIMALRKVMDNADERAHVERVAIAMELRNIEDEMKGLQLQKTAKEGERNIFIAVSVLTFAFVGVGIWGIRRIRLQNRLLTNQKEELTVANETKDKMFAVISHDLRSPLNSIIGSLELMETGALDVKETNVLVKNLHLSASATLETLDNLLQWGAGQLKQEAARHEAVDVNMLTDQTRKLLSNVAAHKSVHLVQKIDDVCIARFDKSQLAFIMRNLMVNAIKFSHEGHNVEVYGRKENDRIILQVKDSGVGMSEDVCKRLFNASDRISERGTAGERGVGLGLVLIQEFLNKNNGKITVVSKEGSGSCFEVNIPAV